MIIFPLLPNDLRNLWIYHLLPFNVIRDISPIRNKVPDREFCWSVDHEFYSRLGIWNCASVWSTEKFVWKLTILRKNESSLEKRKQFHWRIFFQRSWNKVYKKVYKTKVVIQNSAIKCYHEFHVRSHNDS